MGPFAMEPPGLSPPLLPSQVPQYPTERQGPPCMISPSAAPNDGYPVANHKPKVVPPPRRKQPPQMSTAHASPPRPSQPSQYPPQRQGPPHATSPLHAASNGYQIAYQQAADEARRAEEAKKAAEQAEEARHFAELLGRAGPPSPVREL